ncbi:MAG: alpha/beta fold hydrolase [Thermodesulfobacteriota bacterium]
MPIATVNGVNINYEIHGDGNAVVLIGGLGSQLQSWATQVPIYSQYFKVIVFDNRGSGKSDKPEPGYSTQDMADDTAELMSELGIDSAHIVGKSMGGMIGQWLAINHPQKVQKLVMGCSSASRDEVGNEILKMGREIATKIGPKAVWLMALYLGYTREYIEENIGSIKQVMSSVPEDPQALQGYIGQSYACEGHNTVSKLPQISAKTLVMLGENDLIASPRRSKQLSELIPNSELKIFPAVGHGFWRECQHEVDDLVLDFLQND